MRKPWEMQTGETPIAFQAFVLYRDGGEGRSQEKVAELYNRHVSLIARWSAQHKWRDRVNAFENEKDRERLASLRKGRGKMLERHMKIAETIQGKLIQRLQVMTADEAHKLSPQDLTRLLEASVRIERTSRDIPEEVNSSQKIEVVVNTHMDAAEIKRRKQEREEKLAGMGVGA